MKFLDFFFNIGSYHVRSISRLLHWPLQDNDEQLENVDTATLVLQGEKHTSPDTALRPRELIKHVTKYFYVLLIFLNNLA